MEDQRKIVAVGSLNADLVLLAKRLPLPGETLSCGNVATVPGGKGANQAYAAARLGARSLMCGQVGNDAFGPVLIDSLNRAGVDTGNVRTIAGPTGTAFIIILPNGENSILLSPGANGEFIAGEERFAPLELRPGDCLLAQLEVPLETTAAALRCARAAGAITILDPAPARSLPQEVLQLADWLTPNQTEAAILLGREDLEIDSYEQAAAAAEQLRALGARAVIMKLGAMGCVIATADGAASYPSHAVTAVDTTAAGDVFNGAFAVALTEGRDTGRAARFACAAAAISVTRMGAQPSMPSRSEVDEFLALKEAACS